MKGVSDDSFKLRQRLSILIKAAELIYRDLEKLSDKDIIYYLNQIIQESEDCLNIVAPDRNYKKDMC